MPHWGAANPAYRIPRGLKDPAFFEAVNAGADFFGGLVQRGAAGAGDFEFEDLLDAVFVATQGTPM
jgi:hypothetical protein